MTVAAGEATAVTVGVGVGVIADGVGEATAVESSPLAPGAGRSGTVTGIVPTTVVGTGTDDGEGRVVVG